MQDSLAYTCLLMPSSKDSTSASQSGLRKLCYTFCVCIVLDRYTYFSEYNTANLAYPDFRSESLATRDYNTVPQNPSKFSAHTIIVTRAAVLLHTVDRPPLGYNGT